MNIILISVIIFFSFLFVAIFWYIIKLKRELLQVKEYNKSLLSFNDSIRGFRHDFSNILIVIDGYIKANDITGLKKYHLGLMKDYKVLNNLGTLSPKVINNPAIYALLSNKYQCAIENNIAFNIEVFIDFNTLKMSIYEFSRILRNTFR